MSAALQATPATPAVKTTARSLRIVHLPFYDDNPYQNLLMQAQRELGHDVREGGGGGNFLGVALREWRADLLHFHWLHPYLLRPGASASLLRGTRFLAEVALLKRRGARIAWTIHNLANHDGNHPRLELHLTRAFARLCDVCFVHSAAAAGEAADRFGIPARKLRSISHGHYIDTYPNDITPAEARQRLGLPAGARVFLFLGRIERYKGVFELISTFAEMPADAHLVIAGKPADDAVAADLAKLAAADPRLHLHAARIPDEELQVFFNAADAVVFPFRRIFTSGSLVLAMSFGKPVVAPAIKSLMEIVPHGGAHWFEAGNPSSMLAAMMACLDADSAAEGCANLSRARTWTWQSIAQATLTD